MDLIISSAWKDIWDFQAKLSFKTTPRKIQFFIYLCSGSLFNNSTKVRIFFLPWFKFYECLFALSLFDSQINSQVGVLISKYGSLCEMN